MLNLDRMLRAADRRVATLIRGARSRRGDAVEVTDVQLRSTVGYQINAQIHRLRDARSAQPGVLLCPGIHDPGRSFSGWLTPVSAAELARLGCTVLTFDPAGRGKSWGEEDYSGPEHQDNVLISLQHLAARTDVDDQNIGVLSVSLGVAMAVGALAQPDAPQVSWLIDWEGPSDREIITSGGTIMTPAAGHTLEDDVYWRPREAVRHVSKLRCAYIRLQAGRDHAQPGEIRHARRMMRAVSVPDSAVRWFQLNNHARGEVPDRPIWLPSARLAMNHTILRKVSVLIHND
jgi:pimeloyl-ACP methyl ester carboxylesterase